MYTCIITGGPDISPDAASIAASCDVVLCADSGMDYAVDNGIADLVDKIYGDLDSISSEARVISENLEIPIVKYPIEKDMTDTEIILSELVDSDSSIILITSMGGRMDHFIANNNLLLKYKKLGLDITATDGVTDIIPMCGETDIELSLPEEGFEALNVSLIPFSEVSGVSTTGLYYELNNASLHMGDTYSVSNHPISSSIGVKQADGDMLLVINP